MTGPRSAAMAAVAARIASVQSEFEAVRGQVSAELDRMRQEFSPLTEQQERELEEHYRSGAAGPVLRDLQRRVDVGETSWQAIKSGTAPPELTSAYLNSQSKLGQLIKAAAEGKDMDEFLDEQHQQGSYFSAASQQAVAKPAEPPTPPPHTDRRQEPDARDEYSQQSWLE